MVSALPSRRVVDVRRDSGDGSVSRRRPPSRLLRVPVLVRADPQPRGSCPSCGTAVPVTDREELEAVRCAPCVRADVEGRRKP